MDALTGSGVLQNSYYGGLHNVTLGVAGGGGTFAGVIQNGTTTALTLTKLGAGTQTFTGANTFTGTTTISGGTLQLGDGTANNGSLAGNITNNAALIFANPGAQTYGGVISGTGTLTKTGAGMLTLSGSNTYTGATTVGAGQMLLSGASAVASFRSNSSVATGAALEFNLATDATLGLGFNLTGTGTVLKTGSSGFRVGEVRASPGRIKSGCDSFRNFGNLWRQL